jgi:hypothetical protein
VPGYVWIPFIILGAALLLLGVFAFLARFRRGKYLIPIVRQLSKIGFVKRWLMKAQVSQLERSNPELASAVKKMQAFGEPQTPDQVQRALRVLTPQERKAYMDAAAAQQQDNPEIEPTNRQQRRKLEYGGAGMPTRPADSGSARPGSAGRKTGSKRKKR